jgi:hypothetical protein
MLLELLSVSEIGDDHEELQLNVVAACTNLTFYSCRGVSVLTEFCHLTVPLVPPDRLLSRMTRLP